jgi:hypothetical protein
VQCVYTFRNSNITVVVEEYCQQYLRWQIPEWHVLTHIHQDQKVKISSLSVKDHDDCHTQQNVEKEEKIIHGTEKSTKNFHPSHCSMHGECYAQKDCIHITFGAFGVSNLLTRVATQLQFWHHINAKPQTICNILFLNQFHFTVPKTPIYGITIIHMEQTIVTSSDCITCGNVWQVTPMSTYCDITCQASANMTSDVLQAWWSSQVTYTRISTRNSTVDGKNKADRRIRHQVPRSEHVTWPCVVSQNV